MTQDDANERYRIAKEEWDAARAHVHEAQAREERARLKLNAARVLVERVARGA